MATSAGIQVVICNGTEPGTLERAVEGESVGTRFHRQARRESSFKLWLKYAKASSGRVLVDEGAERALREQGTSLLPVGVVDVEGEFEAGDAVDVASYGWSRG
jgi:glutamate 5-kinase